MFKENPKGVSHLLEVGKRFFGYVEADLPPTERRLQRIIADAAQHNYGPGRVLTQTLRCSV